MKKLTNVEIREQFTLVHGDTYDYSSVNYNGSNAKVTIICFDHGEFEQTPKHHKLGSGCSMCSGNRKLSLSEFINRSSIIHDNKFSYNNFIYKNNFTKGEIVCPIHGKFVQTPKDHLSGHSCPKCGGTMKLTKGEFIKRSSIVHSNKYNYSKVNYKNLSNKVTIMCMDHGDYEVTPRNHLYNKSGCPGCSHTVVKSILYYKSHFEKMYNKKYIYDDFKFITSKDLIKIKCIKHGDFKIRLNDHYMGHGCSKCSSSVGETTIRTYLENRNIEYIEQKTFDGCESRNKLPFDFYLPKYNICIEYDGIQHFKPVEFFGGYNEFKKTKKRDYIKNEYCEVNDINLIRVPYFEKTEKFLDEKMDN